MESKRVVLLGMVLVLGLVSRVGAVEPSYGQDPSTTIHQTKQVLSQIWEVAAPWVHWAKTVWQDIFSIVCEKASLAGLRRVAADVGRIGLDFFTGRPYQAAYKVAKDVPVAGKAVKEVIGEANLRRKAASEHAQEKEL